MLLLTLNVFENGIKFRFRDSENIQELRKISLVNRSPEKRKENQ